MTISPFVAFVVRVMIISSASPVITSWIAVGAPRAMKPKKKPPFEKSKKKPTLILLSTTVFVKSLRIHPKKIP